MLLNRSQITAKHSPHERNLDMPKWLPKWLPYASRRLLACPAQELVARILDMRGKMHALGLMGEPGLPLPHPALPRSCMRSQHLLPRLVACRAL